MMIMMMMKSMRTGKKPCENQGIRGENIKMYPGKIRFDCSYRRVQKAVFCNGKITLTVNVYTADLRSPRCSD